MDELTILGISMLIVLIVVAVLYNKDLKRLVEQDRELRELNRKLDDLLKK